MPGYDAWFARTLSNAHLAAVATYHDCVPGLQRELAAAGSLPAFYARAAVLAELPLAERHAAVCVAVAALSVGGRSCRWSLPTGRGLVRVARGARLVERDTATGGLMDRA